MIALIATLGMALASMLLIRFYRDPARVSWAVSIPFIWLSIASSRPVSNWMTFTGPVEASNQYIDGSPVDRNVLTFLLLLAVIALARKARALKAILRANIPLLIFFTYCGISILWADYPFVLLKRWIRALGDLAIVGIILTEAQPAEAMKQVLLWLGSVLIPLSILFTRFFPSLGRSYSYSGVPMWTGVATDKNALGALCMIVGVLLLSRGLSTYRDKENRYRIRRLIITGMLFMTSVYLLAMIDSKTALACFVMASILIALRVFPSAFRKRWLVTCFVVIMLGISYSVLFLGVGSSALAEMGRDTSLTGRTQVWEIVIPFAVNPWIGAGYENFWIGDRLESVIRTIGAGLNQAHNGYIELYLNIGWIGLLLLGIVIIMGYRNILKELRFNPEMAGLKLAFFFICLVYNFTEAAFKFMSPVWITFLWATMAVPKVHHRRLSPRVVEKDSRDTIVMERFVPLEERVFSQIIPALQGLFERPFEGCPSKDWDQLPEPVLESKRKMPPCAFGGGAY